MKKYSNVYYIRKDSEFKAVEKAKTYKNDMGLDLFLYNQTIYEGHTGTQMCGADTDINDKIKNSIGIEKIKNRIQEIISEKGESPRYTRPDERKKDIFPHEKNENIIFAKDVYGKKHHYTGSITKTVSSFILYIE